MPLSNTSVDVAIDLETPNTTITKNSAEDSISNASDGSYKKSDIVTTMSESKSSIDNLILESTNVENVSLDGSSGTSLRRSISDNVTDFDQGEKESLLVSSRDLLQVKPSVSNSQDHPNEVLHGMVNREVAVHHDSNSDSGKDSDQEDLSENQTFLKSLHNFSISENKPSTSAENAYISSTPPNVPIETFYRINDEETEILRRLSQHREIEMRDINSIPDATFKLPTQEEIPNSNLLLSSDIECTVSISSHARPQNEHHPPQNRRASFCDYFTTDVWTTLLFMCAVIFFIAIFEFLYNIKLPF